MEKIFISHKGNKIGKYWTINNKASNKTMAKKVIRGKAINM